ncbi:MAG TPA: hypothetical protein VGM41_14165, partial [Chitinophagaceae bacterium]
MKQLIVSVLVLLAMSTQQQAYAQQEGHDTIPSVKRDSSLAAREDSTAITDSLMKEFEAMVDELVAPKSFVSVGAGLGNRTFSVKNNSLNTQEATTDRLSITPYAGYYHKSGLGITLMGYASSFEDNHIGMYQYAVTPSYDYISHRLAAGISYTRYFAKDTALQSTTPYDNDLYGYVNIVRKSWRYGVALGYATGNFTDELKYGDSLLQYNPVLMRSQWVKYKVTVNSKNRLHDFSVSGMVRRDFEWNDVLKKGDNITLSITSYLVGGSSEMNTTTNANVNLKLRQVTLQRFRRSYKNEDGNTFQLQSAALSFSLYYTVGRFDIAPVWFMDYYFPDSSKRYSQVFSL